MIPEIKQYRLVDIDKMPKVLRLVLRGVIYYQVCENGCLEPVNRVPTTAGYTIIWQNFKLKYLHRLALLFAKGDSRLHACHTCDNPKCFNPDHLFYGTDQDNIDDMIRKGRIPCGEKRHNSILSEVQAIEIKYSKLKTATLSRKFGVNWVTVDDIRKRRTWRHLV